MGIRISGKNFDVGEALRSQALERVTGTVQRYYEGLVTGHVTVAKDGTGFRSDGVLHLSSGITLEATGNAYDAYASLDQMVERIEKRLRRYKQRIKDRSGQSNPRRALAEMPAYVIAAPDHEEEEQARAQAGDHPAIIAEATKSLHELSVGDAVAELDMTGASVVVFRNAGNGRVNVVYRRRDGNIGWVDPPVALS
jgi:ribosomal subunit interface protein